MISDESKKDPIAAPVAIAAIAIVDHGSVVTLVAQLRDGGHPALIQFDRRCFARFWCDWSAAGFPEPLLWHPRRGVVAFA